MGRNLTMKKRQRSPITRFEDMEKQVSALLVGHESGLSIIDELDGKQFCIDMPALVYDMVIYQCLITMLIFLHTLGQEILIKEEVSQAVVNKCAVVKIKGLWLVGLTAADNIRP